MDVWLHRFLGSRSFTPPAKERGANDVRAKDQGVIGPDPRFVMLLTYVMGPWTIMASQDRVQSIIL